MFSNRILQYYHQLRGPANLPSHVVVLNPYQNTYALSLCQQFYDKYYSDDQSRKILFGINPGRLGAGLTGIPFTDPVVLSDRCGIPNHLNQRAELSSSFIYEMISSYGGPVPFYARYYISALSPLGYVSKGVNLNYYDLPNYKILFESYIVTQIKAQLNFNIDRSVAFSVGKGKNFDFLCYLNKKHHFFDAVVPLPHPRWVMQYKLKKKDDFIADYLAQLK